MLSMLGPLLVHVGVRPLLVSMLVLVPVLGLLLLLLRLLLVLG